MKKENAEWLCDVAVHATLDMTFDIREEYSGRSMYGKTTTAIECDSQSDFLELMFAAVLHAGDTGEVPECWGDENGISMDSMGRGVIVY